MSNIEEDEKDFNIFLLETDQDDDNETKEKVANSRFSLENNLTTDNLILESHQSVFRRKYNPKNIFVDDDLLKYSEKFVHQDTDVYEDPPIFLFDPKGRKMRIWLTIISVAITYNIWTVIFRQAFINEIKEIYLAFFITDAIFDAIYVLDIFVRIKTAYFEQGLTVTATLKLIKNALKRRGLILDLISIIPLDLIQFYTGLVPILRFPRLFKLYRYFHWEKLMADRSDVPNFWRIMSSVHFLLITCHWFGCFYYLSSAFITFDEDWTNAENKISVIGKYLRCFYWAVNILTVGDVPKPTTNLSYTFTIVAYFLGVFIFATIVGQVGNIITNRNATRLEFESILDKAKNYMRLHNVPTDMQKRVLRWYDYAWSRGRTHGGGDINQLELLPDKLKTEMALHVNLKVLKKVYMFQECRPEFLHDLVLKMRPYIFTPGDYICRTGEVARELFIIADGVLEVINDQGVVLTKMGSGDFFGEIGILNLDEGMNKRTANVKAVGYVELFVLHRNDVLEALKEHPDAEKLIIQLGTKRLIEIKNDRNKNKSLPPTPSNLVQNMDEPKEEIQKKNSEPNRPSAFFSNLEEELFDKIRKEKIKMIQEKDELLSQIDNMKNQIKSLEEEIEMYRSKK